MARVWYCPNCGYEVYSRGRCHSCGERLSASPLPELVTGPEDEEVGYEIEGWTDRDRGMLIERLIHLGIEHRFEGDELVVEASDEERVDDLVAALGDSAEAALAEEDEEGDDREGRDDVEEASGLEHTSADDRSSAEPPTGEDDDAIRLLLLAAARLRQDPTDMQADADVAEASSAVFMLDRYGPLDEEQWSAVGRVTRLLLSLLGADEPLEDDIRREAAVLEKLLEPAGPGAGGASLPAGDGISDWTVYELAEWLPEQRAQLTLILEDHGIAYRWDGVDLLVPESREDEVEVLFEEVGGSLDEHLDESGDEERYRAVAELFAATGRLAADPDDPSRREAVRDWVGAADGPALLGMDEIAWLRIRNRARAMADALDDDDVDRIYEEATTLHDMLRAVV